MATSSLSPPDANAQKAIIEPLLSKPYVEGDFWYAIVADWLNQWKRYVGIVSLRKYYHDRATPGPIITTKEFSHSIDPIHEDAWKLLLQWYGLTDGHKITKKVVYSYGGKYELESNLNSFKSGKANSVVADTHVLKFSKLEKVGHVEFRLRQLYSIKTDECTRLWGKCMETDTLWKPLFNRDKAIGKELMIDSDFIRSAVAIEIRDPDEVWRNRPAHAQKLQENATGKLCDHSIFEEVTTNWELDIHNEIDALGKTFLEKLHTNFNTFLDKGKDFIAEKQSVLEHKDKSLNKEEEKLAEKLKKLEIRERKLERDLERQEHNVREFQKDCESRKEELTKQWEVLEVARAKLIEDRTTFDTELKNMAELHAIQDSRIKLDIGGHIFTTSVMTLTKDPDSMLAAMFSGRHRLKEEKDGSHFIDRDGTHFRYILNYLRDGGVQEGTLPKNENVWRELLTEAEYYQIEGLRQYLMKLVYKKRY
ncbi:unnamed protein product [Owenia fusiformis]|uniref:DUSP domain-containing protein n=1 Tax=Owenia fusiformis TaxID=6347 RepID=A0A8S4NR63_OWEFU|nr:unnamed protein product [Owenia fusiformis]